MAGSTTFDITDLTVDTSLNGLIFKNFEHIIKNELENREKARKGDLNSPIANNRDCLTKILDHSFFIIVLSRPCIDT